eukprot:6206435-Pleurochrysis_carterae.AAC.2
MTSQPLRRASLHGGSAVSANRAITLELTIRHRQRSVACGSKQETRERHGHRHVGTILQFHHPLRLRRRTHSLYNLRFESLRRRGAARQSDSAADSLADAQPQIVPAPTF